MPQRTIGLVGKGTELERCVRDAWEDSIFADTSHPADIDFIHITDESDVIDIHMVLVVEDTPSEDGVHLVELRKIGVPILTVRGHGSTILVGPLETPGHPVCSTCLQIRWDNSIRRAMVNRVVTSKFSESRRPHIPLSLDDKGRQAIGQTVVEEMLNGVLCVPSRANGHVGIYRRGHAMEWVPLVPSHGCPRCGGMMPDNPSFGRIEFQPVPVSDVETLRTKAVDYEALTALYVHPDVGYIAPIQELMDETYVRANATVQLPRKIPLRGYGSSLSALEAKRTALLEALERVCTAAATNRVPTVKGTYRSLNENAIDPRQFGLHMDTYYDRNPNMEPYDEERSYAWVWAYSTRRNEPVLIPEQIAHYDRTHDSAWFVRESSNGSALGHCVEEAVLHGLFEVLERDGFLNMWFGRMAVPEVTVGLNAPQSVRDNIDLLHREGYRLRLFSVSHDFSVPAILAVAEADGAQFPKVVCGTSCHLNPYEAVNGALRELIMQVFQLRRNSMDRILAGMDMLSNPTKVRHMLDHVLVAALPESYPHWAFLLNNAGVPQSIEDLYSTVSDRHSVQSKDLRLILESVISELHHHGFDVMVVNQTNVEVAYGGMFSMKVLVPGLTPINFGYGSQRTHGLSRLYELPYRLGYSFRMLCADDLNPICHPFA